MKTLQTESNNLTAKQRRIIPFLVSARSVEEGRKSAGVSQETVWRWMKNQAFRQELENAREAFVSSAFSRLQGAITGAVDVLVQTMTGTDAILRVRAAGMVLDHFWKARELQELESRLKRIEEILEADGRVKH